MAHFSEELVRDSGAPYLVAEVSNETFTISITNQFLSLLSLMWLTGSFEASLLERAAK